MYKFLHICVCICIGVYVDICVYLNAYVYVYSYVLYIQMPIFVNFSSIRPNCNGTNLNNRLILCAYMCFVIFSTLFSLQVLNLAVI